MKEHFNLPDQQEIAHLRSLASQGNSKIFNDHLSAFFKNTLTLQWQPQPSNYSNIERFIPEAWRAHHSPIGELSDYFDCFFHASPHFGIAKNFIVSPFGFMTQYLLEPNPHVKLYEDGQAEMDHPDDPVGYDLATLVKFLKQQNRIAPFRLSTAQKIKYAYEIKLGFNDAHGVAKIRSSRLFLVENFSYQIAKWPHYSNWQELAACIHCVETHRRLSIAGYQPSKSTSLFSRFSTGKMSKQR